MSKAGIAQSCSALRESRAPKDKVCKFTAARLLRLET